MLSRIVLEGHLDPRRHFVCSQSALDRLLRWYCDPRIPFDDRLTGQRVACRDIGRGETHGRTAAHGRTRLVHDHRATTATALAAARLVEFDAGQTRSLCDHRSARHDHRLVAGIEMDMISSHY